MSKAVVLPAIFTETSRYAAQDHALIERAFRFAHNAHEGQFRVSGEPYIMHPLAAAETLAKLNLDARTIAAALLHDVVDDTPVAIDDIEKEFGKEVAFLVNGVTKLGKLKYRGEERRVENLRKMFLAMAEDIRVVLIKFADRLHNMQTLAALPEQKRRRIALETLEMYAPLAGRLGIGDIRGQLEDLAFPHVYPEEYQWLMNAIKEPHRERKEYVERVKPVFEEYLLEAGITPVDVHARAKHYWTLYQKLLRKDMDITKIYDLVALRAVVPKMQDCYATLGVIHKNWKPLPGRIKDYIALPKPNGYQSIHTTVFCMEGKMTEFQIRTPLMHEHAEHGIAAHWAWAETGKAPQTEFRGRGKFAWVEQLRNWQKEIQGSDEFLGSLKIDFFRDRIFAFTPKGDVIDLPDGATPVDFAYHIHSDVGNRASGARVNGKYVSLDTALTNGDVVEIVIQKSKRPSHKWFDFVRTNLARSHIRKALREAGIELRTPKPMAGKKAIRTFLTVHVEDRVGLLRDISNLFSASGINLLSAAAGTNPRSGVPSGTVRVEFELQDKERIRKLIASLEKIPDVLEVEYKMGQ